MSRSTFSNRPNRPSHAWRTHAWQAFIALCASLALALLVTPSIARAQATTQYLAIFGAQADPDPTGRGPGFPEILAPNTEYCTSNCGDLADGGYFNTALIDNVLPISAVEAATGSAATWETAFLSGDHPWGTLCVSPGFPVPAGGPCSNSWLNYRSNDESVLDPTTGLYPSIRYRVRFNVPTFPTDPVTGEPLGTSMTVKMKADNWGKAWINGEAVPGLIWGSSTLDGSAEFAATVHPGENIIELVVGDGGGLAGFTYLVELSIVADEPLEITPPPGPPPEGIPSGAPVVLDAGARHHCAWHIADGNVNCWPSDAAGNNYGQSEDYNGGDAIGYDTGDYTNCILRADGNTHCWGYLENELSYTGGDATQVSTGYGHACVLTTDGNVNCAGAYVAPSNAWTQKYGGGDAEWVVSSSYAACVKTAAPELTCFGWNVTEPSWSITGGTALPRGGGHYSLCLLTDGGNIDCMNSNYNEIGQSAGYYGGDAVDVNGQFGRRVYATTTGTVDTFGGAPPAASTATDALSVSVDGLGYICWSNAASEVDCTLIEPDPYGVQDADEDGVADEDDNCPNDANPDQLDTDNDGEGDVCDADDDNDGIPDGLDAFPLDPTESSDADGDGIGDNADADDDNDGVLDVDDAFPTDPTESSDADGDGIGDNADTDDDNDGVPDVDDAFPFDPTESSDNDGDGIGDNADPDDDNDGVPDVDDAFPFDPTESSDNDDDGIGDNADTDDDNDGVPDVDDAFPYDPTESSDNDGDGIGDNADTDDDNDGVPDVDDAFPFDPTESADADGDGIGDNADPDDDNDSVEDGEDACGGTVIPEATVPSKRLKRGRWALVDDDTYFDTAPPRWARGRALWWWRKWSRFFRIPISYTGGCSCEQIIDELDLRPRKAERLTKFGCTRGVLERFRHTVLHPPPHGDDDSVSDDDSSSRDHRHRRGHKRGHRHYRDDRSSDDDSSSGHKRRRGSGKRHRR